MRVYTCAVALHASSNLAVVIDFELENLICKRIQFHD